MKSISRRTLLLLMPMAVGGSALAASSLVSMRAARAATMAEPARDEGAVALLNSFVRALQNGDDAARVQAVLPLLHRSLLTGDGGDIEPTTKKFAWKKATQNGGNYASPVDVTRVRAKGTLTIGEGNAPEKGRVDDYFIAKKPGVSGLAATITIFFPDNGTPKILYFGGL